MKALVILFLTACSAWGQSFSMQDQAFLGTVHSRPSPQWLSYVSITGSPVSAWGSAYGAISLSQSTSTNQPTITASAFGSTQGIIFDGISKVLSYTGKPISNTQAGSLSVVFKTGSSVTGPFVIVSQSDSAAANDWWEFGIDANGKLYVESDAAGTKHTVEGSTVLATSTAYNAILTYDGTDYYLTLNGTEENPLVIVNVGAFAWAGRVGGTTVFSVGATVTSGGTVRPFNGSLGAVAFWNYDITQ